MKKIPLTKGKYAVVDDDDYEYIMQWSWCLGTGGYAVRGGRKEDGLEKRRNILMHTVINGTPDDKETDHINGDRLDNRKSNLRAVSSGKNQMNKVKRPLWDKSREKWVVTLRYWVDGNRKRYIKRFDLYKDALMHLKEKAWELQKIQLR